MSIAVIRQHFDALVDLSVEEQITALNLLACEQVELANTLRDMLQLGSKLSFNTNTVHKRLSETIEQHDVSGWIGRRIGDFVISALVGKGGMSRVYKATRTDSGVMQEVALKLLRDAQDQRAQSRFQREWMFLAELTHPNICRFIDCGISEDGTGFVATELIEGADLLSDANARQLTITQRVELMQGVMAGVSYAHQRLIVHRDLKPSNVLVDRFGVPKLLDFGIAQRTSSDAKETERWFTAQYASPEQVQGKTLTTQSDVYSLGAMLYELCDGKPAFDFTGKTPAEVERILLQQDPPKLKLGSKGLLSKLAEFFSASQFDLDCIVRKAMQADLGKRYRTVDEFSDDLNKWLKGQPISAKPESAWDRGKKFVRRNRAASAFVSAMLITIVLSAGILLQKNAELKAEKDRAELSLSFLTDTLSSADPFKKGASDMRVRDLLANFQTKIHEVEQRSPRDFVYLAAQLGELQLDLEFNEQTNQMLTRAYDAAVRLQDSTTTSKLRRLRIRYFAAVRETESALDLIALEKTESPDVDSELLWLEAESLSALPERLQGYERAMRANKFSTSKVKIEVALRYIDMLIRENKTDVARIELAKLQSWLGEWGNKSKATTLRIRMTELRLNSLDNQNGRFLSEAKNFLQSAENEFGRSSFGTARAFSLMATQAYDAAEYQASLEFSIRARDTFAAVLGADNERGLREQFNAASLMVYLKDARASQYFDDLFEAALKSRVITSQTQSYFVFQASDYLLEKQAYGAAIKRFNDVRYNPSSVDANLYNDGKLFLTKAKLTRCLEDHTEDDADCRTWQKLENVYKK